MPSTAPAKSDRLTAGDGRHTTRRHLLLHEARRSGLAAHAHVRGGLGSRLWLSISGPADLGAGDAGVRARSELAACNRPASDGRLDLEPQHAILLELPLGAVVELAAG